MNLDYSHNAAYVADTNLSDHKAIVIELNVTKQIPRPKKIRFRPVTEADLNTLYNNLSKIDWYFINDTKMTKSDEKFNIFLNIFIEQINLALPIKIKTVTSELPKIEWYNDELREMRENLNFLYYLKKTASKLSRYR